MSTEPIQPDTMHQLRAGINAEWLTIVWMVIEAAVSFSAGLAAGSIALIAFGADSIIELIAGGVLLWRLTVGRDAPGGAERVERAEGIGSKVVGWSLLALAAYVAVQAAYDLWTRAVPDSSLVGIALAAAALVVMPALVRTKLRVARAIESPALRGDAMCGVVCAYMAATLLVGLGLRAVCGWWWADPVAALGIVYFIVHEGLEALSAERGCACGH
jgi:divalent metal cation (Fe/Co/Zn/Cd) transporter